MRYVLLLFLCVGVWSYWDTSDYIDCQNGAEYLPLTHTYQGPGICNCTAGWGGPDCSMCLTNDVCGDGQWCSPEFLAHDSPFYSCKVPAQGGFFTSPGYITARFDKLDSGKGSGYLQVLMAKPRAAPIIFNCTMNECQVKKSTGTQTFSCGSVNCFCTDYCDESNHAAPIVAGIKQMDIVCDVNTQMCTYSGVITLRFDCSAAVCTSKRATSAGTAWTGEVQLALLIALIIFPTLFLAFITSIYFIARPLWKYDLPAIESYSPKYSLAWEYVSCTIKNAHSGKNRTILNNVTGIAQPGELVAIMGPSGGGKTTFIDILAGRKNTGQVEGNILMNGSQIGAGKFSRLTGYVMQDEKLLGTLTVKEHLMYVARLKLPSNMNHYQREAKVIKVLADLGISHISDTYIGTEMTRGVSGGEKRRVAIASELVCDPSVLFLDEPTSGLDSHTSFALMKRLRMMAHDRQKTVILSIHQPNSGIFSTFDKILLLCKGECVYFGPRAQVINHFHSIGYEMPANYNPPDFLLQTVMEVDNNTIRKMARIYREGQTCRAMIAEVDDAKERHETNKQASTPNLNSNFGSKLLDRALTGINTSTARSMKEHRVGWFSQVYWVAHRTWLNSMRNPYLLRFQYLAVTLLGLILGGVYWHIGFELIDAQNLMGGIFFMLALLSFGSMSSLDVFFSERSLFVRERANGMYTTSSYYVARAIVDLIPMRVIPAAILGTTTYFMIGLDVSDWQNVACYIGTFVVVSLCASTLCFAISSVSPSLAFANLLTILMLLFCMLFGGFLVNNAVGGILGIFQYMSFINFGFDLIVCQQFPSRRVRVLIPGSKDRYLDLTGNAVLEELKFDPARKHLDMIGMASWFAVYFVLAYIFLRFVVKERR